MTHRRRSGTTLIELLVVLTLCGVILSLSATCLHHMYRADQQARQRLEQQQGADRLMIRLRVDAHAAQRVESIDSADEDSRGIVLMAANDDVIRYETSGEGIQRTVQAGGEIVHRDRFRLPSVAEIRWQRLPGTAEQVRLEIAWSSPGEARQHRAVDRILTVVGLPSDQQKEPN